MSKRFQKSEEFLKRALETIPLGTQTFSKSRTQYPLGVSPYFLNRAQGCRVWDLDGNEYIDFNSGLASITLGYKDPDVNYAVRSQLDEGVLFSLSHPIEVQVAEKIVEMVPCAQMVRFGKNGSDATAGAIRLARAYTGRDHVAICGYHGWQDWYIGSTSRNLGVPQATRDLTHPFNYNDIDSLHQLFCGRPDQIAAVILEPMNSIEPKENFLEQVKELTHKNGAILIFDEMITGFRLANGGAQEYFKVTPDLATFGKGLANGYPLSAVTGRGELMRLFEEVFFSFTYGGETLSLAAALATLTKLQRQPVIETLRRQGSKIVSGVRKKIEEHQIGHILSIQGHPAWSLLSFRNVAPYTRWQIKTLFLQEMFARGILMLETHTMNYAHQEEDCDQLLRVYDEVFPFLKDVVDNKSLENHLRCQPIKPLFTPRCVSYELD